MNPNPLTLEQPLDIDDARRASRALATLRRDAEDALEKRTEEAAEKERQYRKAYATAFIQATGTAAEREAVAKSEASQEAYERDLAAGMVKVGVERLRGLEGERSQLKSLTEWSMRLDPAANVLRESEQMSRNRPIGVGS
jgi:hypothetical protein